MNPALALYEEAKNLADELVLSSHETPQPLVGFGQGSYHQRRSGNGDDFWQYRYARAGDSLSQIDWKRSMRSQRLLVRENEQKTSCTLWLWVDRAVGMNWHSAPHHPRKLQRARVLALALASLCGRHGERTGMLDPAFPPAQGPGRLERMARQLMDSSPSRSLGSCLHVLNPGDQSILFSDFFHDMDQIVSWIDCFCHSRCSVILCQILDPAELSFPYSGHIRFTLPEEGSSIPQSYETQNAHALAQAYHDRLKEHQEKLTTLAALTGGCFLSYETVFPPANILRNLWELSFFKPKVVLV